MAQQDGYLWHIVAALGKTSDIPTNFEEGELGYVTDSLRLIVGDGTPTPCQIATNKSTGSFSYSSLSSLTMPGGINFATNRPGAVGAITPQRMTAGVGLLAYKGNDSNGQDLWNSVTVGSQDQTLIVANGNGSQAALDLRINPDSQILKNLIATIIAQTVATSGTSQTTTSTGSTTVPSGNTTTLAYVPVPTSTSWASFGLSANQSVYDNVDTTFGVSVTNGPPWATATNGVITFSKSGLYVFHAYSYMTLSCGSNEAAYFQLSIRQNGTTLVQQSSYGNAYYYLGITIACSTVAYVNAGDTVVMVGNNHAGNYDPRANTFNTPSNLLIGKVG